jgi:putative phosphoesterase
MKICIISDSHDNRRLMDHAVEDAKARGAEAVLHCGDVVAPTTLRVLKKHGLPVHVIHGNNTGDMFSMAKLASEAGSMIHYYGPDAGITLGGKNVFLVHYPHYARGMAATGDWDLVCCGHDHRSEIQWVPNIKGGKTLMINPGTVGGVGSPATYVFGDLSTMEFEVMDVPVQVGELCNMPRVTDHR